jgi:hypothetical protein
LIFEALEMLLEFPGRFRPSEAVDFETVLLLEAAHHLHGHGTIDAVLVKGRLGAELVERLLHPQNAVGDVLVLLRCIARYIEPDGRVHGSKHLERDRGPELRIDVVGIEVVIAGVLAALSLRWAVERRAAIEVGRVHALAVVAEAVEGLQTITDALDAPVLGAEPALDLEGVYSAFLEGRERPPAFGLEPGHPIERLASAEIGIEVEGRLA